MTGPATTQIYTLSLHDALPISRSRCGSGRRIRRSPDRPGAPLRRLRRAPPPPTHRARPATRGEWVRSEEHTSELQSRVDLVCRLLLEKKKKTDRQTRQEPHDMP